MGSQTIHASLDNDLNNSGLDENDLMVPEADGATSKANGAGKSFEGDSTVSPVATQHDKVFFFFFFSFLHVFAPGYSWFLNLSRKYLLSSNFCSCMLLYS